MLGAVDRGLLPRQFALRPKLKEWMILAVFPVTCRDQLIMKGCRHRPSTGTNIHEQGQREAEFVGIAQCERTGDFEIGRIPHLKSEIAKSQIGRASPKSNSKFRNFGSEMQDSSNFKMSLFVAESSMLMPLHRKARSASPPLRGGE